ncbi:MAG: type 3 dihydrofolate reductase [Gammaproteobacteria bacterium]|nr:type 3 dihydrofolate reductase [Gammaproteobacteria bacterium]
MKISIIAAMARNRVIGKGNTMPWHLPAELRHFKQVTMGKPIIMGRKTFDSIGRALSGRRNIVITHDPDYRFEGVVVVHSIEQALIAAGDADEVMIIGGGHLYQQMINRAERLYLTLIDAVIEGDTFFPKIKNSEWQEIKNVYRPADEKNRHVLRFLVFEKLF